ncbi:hypothetical protein BD779DRAFT_466971 [Infundibulicybe gibba]|nr:hypothetical protein BD779DRAFT_466971 [Infundibulicybe gibba]
MLVSEFNKVHDSGLAADEPSARYTGAHERFACVWLRSGSFFHNLHCSRWISKLTNAQGSS